MPPVGDGPWPAVVVLHESFGLTDDIRQQAERLAAAGYLAVAPDLYTAGGRWRGTAGKLDAALERAGVAHDVQEYPGAGHSFLNRHDFGPGGALLRVAGVGYHGPSAEDAWRRILRFFDEQLHPRGATA